MIRKYYDIYLCGSGGDTQEKDKEQTLPQYLDESFNAGIDAAIKIAEEERDYFGPVSESVKKCINRVIIQLTQLKKQTT